MAHAYIFLLTFLFLFLFFIHPSHSWCQESFQCGRFGTLNFPFSSSPDCGPIFINCTSSFPIIKFPQNSLPYGVVKNVTTNKFILLDLGIHAYLNKNSCIALRPLRLPHSSPSISLTISYPKNATILSCANNLQHSDLKTIETFFQKSFEVYKDCAHFDIYYSVFSSVSSDSIVLPKCKIYFMPIKTNQTSNLFELLSAEFEVEFHVSEECVACHLRGGICSTNQNNKLKCQGAKNKTTISSPTITGIVLVVVGIEIFVYRCSRMDIAALAASTPELERMNASVPIFSYDELEEATAHFHPSRELGQGGFGTVYHGILKDGREIGVKRFYHHRTLEAEVSFDNEIHYLSQLKHPNLVVLYGCTSKTNEGLLLVYEYVSNGSLVDHLHGPRVVVSPLTWPIRLRIAIETASAISYLHQSNIIHGDIKSANILLDQDQHAKVADFGLAEGYPSGVEYQLDAKNDVYCFGVVLLELISSKQSLDVNRPRDEVQLADFAMARIKELDYDAIFDPALGNTTNLSQLDALLCGRLSLGVFESPTWFEAINKSCT